MGKEAPLYSCAAENQVHFTNTYRNEPTSCLKYKFLNMHVIILFCQCHKNEDLKCRKYETCANCTGFIFCTFHTVEQFNRAI